MSSEKQKIQAMVSDFSSRMEAKLQSKRGRGWKGWSHDLFKKQLEDDLLLHLKLALQGDATQWVDVANYAAFLDYQIRQSTDQKQGDE